MKVDVHDNKDKKVAMRAVSSLQGDQSDLFLFVSRNLPLRDFVSMDTKNEKLTVIGIVDPMSVVGKL